jgi:hypothetical protein
MLEQDKHFENSLILLQYVLEALTNKQRLLTECESIEKDD